jgi:ferredoxin
MPIVIVNDEEVEAEEGENLLDIARRCAAHIGFICGGHGICMACVCHVREGAEHLSEPNSIERRGLPKMWIDRGHRVACQTTLVGPGPVEIISRPEELWRQLQTVLKAPDSNEAGRGLFDFAVNIGNITLQQWLSFPMSTVNAVYQATKTYPSPTEVGRLVKDTGRVLKRMRGDDEEEEEAEGAEGAAEDAPTGAAEPQPAQPQPDEASPPARKKSTRSSKEQATGPSEKERGGSSDIREW